MLRPTLAEIISGIQRTILETLFAELSSPYAQGQAAMAAGDLTHVVSALEKAPAYDVAEIADLAQTLTALRPQADAIPSPVRPAFDSGVRAAETNPIDRRAMEAAMAALAAALALDGLDHDVADQVRGYLRRYLDRTRNLLQTAWGA
jgi:hypothetical protein